MPTQVTAPKVISIKLANGGTAKYRNRLIFSEQVEIGRMQEKEDDGFKAGLFMISILMVSWDLVDEKNKNIPVNLKNIDTHFSPNDITRTIKSLNKETKISVVKKKR